MNLYLKYTEIGGPIVQSLMEVKNQLQPIYFVNEVFEKIFLAL